MIKIATVLVAVAFVLSLAGNSALAKAKAKPQLHRAKPAPAYHINVRKPYHCGNWDAYGVRCDDVGHSR
jgi:hypothetical protein